MEKLVIVLFWLAFILYAGAFVLYAYLLATKKPFIRKLATTTTGLGLITQTIAIAIRWYSAGFIPISEPFESLFLFVWFIAIIYFALEHLSRMKQLGVIVMPLLMVLLGIAWSRYTAPSQMSAAVQNAWTVLHFSIAYFAYGGYTISAAFGVLYILQEYRLKRHLTSRLLARLPSLEELDSFGTAAVAFAEPFMTMSIIMGMIRAQQLGSPWLGDPLIISTFLIWAVYALYLLADWFWGWKGRRGAYLAIGGFVLILFLRFIAINYTTVFHG